MATVAARPRMSFAGNTIPHMAARRQARAGQPHSEKGGEGLARARTSKLFKTSAGLVESNGRKVLRAR